jgi:cation diffusion facilitator CzcD-associated flavoprotein CzcO
VKPHVAILGAGPVGLEAALAAAEHGRSFTLYEAAPQIAGHVRRWAHVRLFTPWTLNVSPRMRRSLAAAGRPVPENDACPTGSELVERVFEPLAALPEIHGHLRLGTTVRRVGRRGLLKHEEIGSAERARRPVRRRVRDAGGPHVEEAGIVLDCTGTSIPNAIGDGGIPAPGEADLGDRVSQDIPDLEREADPWRGKRVLLVGAGHSAQTAVQGLVGLDSGTQVTWVLRGEQPSFGVVEDDPLPERYRLGRAAADLAASPPAGLTLHRGAVVEALKRDGEAVQVTLRNGAGEETVTVDRVLALTGRVGDHRLYRQLQVHECYATAGPMKLAAALMSAGGSTDGDCLAQSSQGAETLTNPEPGFFILGSKSYGRRTDFLMRVGWQQVDEVFELLGA